MLLASAGPAVRERLSPSAELEEALRGLIEAGQTAWPDLTLAPEAFIRHLAERLPDDGDPRAALAATHAGDLYLACACTAGDDRAIAAFETHFISQIGKYLSRSDALPAVADEIKQVVRTNLLVGKGELVPRIAGYSGRGPLGAWLRVTATRAALRLRDSQRAKGQLDGYDPAAFPAKADPELDYLRTNYAQEFRAAFESTLGALSPREATLLRLYFLDGMTIEAIGSLFKVSGRTIKRWLAHTRQRILRETHKRLAERLRISSSELEHLIGLLRSQLDVSIVRYLDKPG